MFRVTNGAILKSWTIKYFVEHDLLFLAMRRAALEDSSDRLHTVTFVAILPFLRRPPNEVVTNDPNPRSLGAAMVTARTVIKLYERMTSHGCQAPDLCSYHSRIPAEVEMDQENAYLVLYKFVTLMVGSRLGQGHAFDLNRVRNKYIKEAIDDYVQGKLVQWSLVQIRIDLWERSRSRWNSLEPLGNLVMDTRTVQQHWISRN